MECLNFRRNIRLIGLIAMRFGARRQRCCDPSGVGFHYGPRIRGCRFAQPPANCLHPYRGAGILADRNDRRGIGVKRFVSAFAALANPSLAFRVSLLRPACCAPWLLP